MCVGQLKNIYDDNDAANNQSQCVITYNFYLVVKLGAFLQAATTNKKPVSNDIDLDVWLSN